MADKVLLFVVIGCYVASTVLFAGLTLSDRRGLRRGALAVATLGLGLHAVAIGIRWAAAGHGPYINTYEVLSSNAWVLVLAFLLLQLRYGWVTSLGPLVMAVAFLMLGAGLMGSEEVKRLPPTLQSSWLIVHILFAKLMVTSIALASGIGIVFLIKERRREQPAWLARMPAPAVLDDYGYRLVAFAFITLSCMIIAGAIWANASWGSYWSWDPTETWSLVVWFVYGLYLHGRVTFRWRGRISAWFVVISFCLLLVAFFVLPYFVRGQHSQYMTG